MISLYLIVVKYILKILTILIVIEKLFLIEMKIV